MFDMNHINLKGEIECPACGKDFAPDRGNKAYCSRCCQKNASRGFRHLENFARDELEAARARDLRDMLYAAPQSERLDVMKGILHAAYYDGGLRNILTRPELLADSPYSSGRGRMNIAKAADAYCKKFLQMSVRSYVRHVRSQLKAKSICELLDVDIEVARDRNDHRPVPVLNKLTAKNVKCIHRELPEGNHETDQADFDWVDQICEGVDAHMLTIEPVDIPEQPDLQEQPSDTDNGKQEAKRKIALSRACFDKGVGIDSHLGRTLARSMGLRSL
jgi:hypothetical protein